MRRQVLNHRGRHVRPSQVHRVRLQYLMSVYGHGHNQTLPVRENQRAARRSAEAGIRRSVQLKQLVHERSLACRVQRLQAEGRMQPIQVRDQQIVQELNGGDPLI